MRPRLLTKGTFRSTCFSSAGRLLAGCGVGTASLVVPRYLVEIAPVAIRGALGTFSQV